MWRHAFLHALALVTPSLLAAQAPTDSAPAQRLAERATELRAELERDTTLRSWRATAHGFVFFLAQVGEGLADAPRLVKADELEVEVYWRAPGPHKQVVQRWRDGRWLPSDLHYHRDHLGIVTGDFGPRIRLGEGDEVRDVPHPLSAEGLRLYAFAAGESLRIRTPDGEVAVRVVTVRPRDASRPGVIGELYIDANSAELVRFRFGFTAAAYRDRDVEDITVVLENGRWEGRWWLPVRQEIEIRRRSAWLDFPMRGVIRGRWEIGDYRFNEALPDSVVRGPAIGGLVEPDNEAGGWAEPLAQAVEAAAGAPLAEEDLAELRHELEQMAGAQVLAGLPASRPAAGSVSDIVRVTRVEGLAVGFGWTFKRGVAEVRPSLGYGTSGVGVSGRLRVGARLGAFEPWIEGRRRVRDVNDFRVIAPLLNSILAQEGGNDHGDWVLEEAVEVGVRVPRGARTALGAAVAFDRTESLAVEAEPSSGEYRANPALGEGDAVVMRAWAERWPDGRVAGWLDGWHGVVEVEGSPDERWVRGRIGGEAMAAAGVGDVLLRVEGIWGSAHLPAWRSIALGGRGTLVGEEYRSLGGLRGGFAHLEWRIPVPVPEFRLSEVAGTGRSAVVAPFVAGGWADGELDGRVPWAPSDGLRPVVGVGLELLMGLVRVEAGVALRTGEWGVTADVGRAWWGIL